MTAPAPDSSEDEIDLRDIVLRLWRYRFFIVGVTLLVTSLVALHQVFVAEVVYRSQCVIVPKSEKVTGGLAAQLGALGGMLGMDRLSEGQDTVSLEMLLNSRGLRKSVAQKMKILERIGGTPAEAIEYVESSLKISADKKSSSLKLTWDDADPAFSKEALECTLETLEERVVNMQDNKRQERHAFLEKRMAEAQHELTQAEEELKGFQVSTQGINLDDQAKAIIEQLTSIKQTFLEATTELNVKRKFLSAENHEVRVLGMSLDEMNHRMSDLIQKEERGKSDADVAGNNLIERSLMEIPGLGLDYARRLRDVQMRQRVLGIIVEQFELARIELHVKEQKFVVVDPPYTLDRRVAPKRTLATAVAAMAALMMSILLVFIRDWWRALPALNAKDTGRPQ